MYDVVVCGLGPAGATAAYRLAKHGFNVAAIDREKFPRYKPCGGCISAKIDKYKDFDFYAAVDGVIYGARFTFRSKRPLDIISDRPIGYTVRRDVFDDFLVRKARDAGAEIFEKRRAIDLIENDDSVTVACDTKEEFTAKIFISADGAGGTIARKFFGLNPKEMAVSLTSEIPSSVGSELKTKGMLYVDFGVIRHGYGWVFPKNGVLSAGIAGKGKRVKNIKGAFDSFAGGCGVFKKSDIKEIIGWTIPGFYGEEKRLTRARSLAIGDAGHLVDPFLGEGIYHAINSAYFAAGVIKDCLKSGKIDLSPYDEWLKREIYPDFSYALKIGNLVYNHPRLWYTLLEKNPKMMLRYYNVIRGEEDHRAFYEWVKGQIRKKPWKLVMGWLESRFL